MRAGRLQHFVALENPGAPVADGDGGFTQTWTSLTPPNVWAAIMPATARELERVMAGTVLSTATHIVSMRYHPEVTTQTRITFGTRRFSVTGVANPKEQGVELQLICAEVVE